MMQRVQEKLAAKGFDPGPIDGDPGPKTYAALFRFMGATDSAEKLGEGGAKHFRPYQVNTALRLSHWFGQFAHETEGFQKFEENLNYTAQRLPIVWPTRFANILSAEPYAHNARKLANKVYGGRMGNTDPDDGWRYHGRGACHLTGKDQYQAAEMRTGLPLVASPELAAQIDNAVLIACDYWQANNCNRLADRDDLVSVTRAINGGSQGLQSRRSMTLKAQAVLL